MTEDVKSSSVSGHSRISQPAVLDTLRTFSQQRLAELLRTMFDRLPDVLHELSRDLPEADQQPYLDAASLMKRKRAELESRFAAAANTLFLRLQPGRESKDAKTAGSIDFSNLTLVTTEDMDITVTLDSIIARARLKYAAPLGLLRRRYAHALGRAEFAERDMPLDPSGLATAFKDAVAPLETGVKEKITVLRVFQQKVLDELGAILEEANRLFVSAGVLPDLKVVEAAGPAKKPAPPKPVEKAKEELNPAKNTEKIFSFLQGLLGQSGSALGGDGLGELAPTSGPGMAGASYHAGQYLGGGGIGALPAAAVGGSVAAVPIAPQKIAPTATVQRVETPELVNRLSQIQQHQPKVSLADDASSPSVEQVRSSIRDNLRSDDATVEAIRRKDEDVINLVSMLFDFVLGDKDLPAAMKALIGRLQVPMLKVAILDKSFFSDEGHPARRLLNALARAGIGWSSRSTSGDVLYAKIEDVVLRILNDFTDDLDLFDQLLQEFTAFCEQQQKRVEAVDRRTRETEEGRARAELARAMVQQTLNRRLAGKQLPTVAIKLLQDAWRNVLYINCLKEGTESESWKQAVKVVDAVIWSVSPQPGNEWRSRLAALAPKLLNSLRKGLASVNFDPLVAERLLRELGEVHAAVGRGEALRTVGVMDARTAQAKPAAGRVAVAEIGRSDAADVAAVVLPEDETSLEVDNALPEDNEFVLLASRLNVGSWMEFIDGEKRERHKLVARIRSVDKLIFANRRGMKVAEMSGMKLAVDMSLGRARVVEEAEFIDRALESMIGSLRDIGSKAGSPQGASASA